MDIRSPGLAPVVELDSQRERRRARRRDRGRTTLPSAEARLLAAKRAHPSNGCRAAAGITAAGVVRLVVAQRAAPA